MHATLRPTRLPLTMVLLVAGVCRLTAASENALDFNRDVRPILAEHCFHCHGQDAKERKGKLRLDESASAIALRDGHAAIVPGKPDASELVKRLITSDPDDLMPPPEAKRPLTPAQITTLTRWIKEGAVYDRHWSFSAPKSPLVPKAGEGWARSSVDRFIAERLSSEGLTPTAEAAPATWLRRVSLDLSGLPAEPTDLDAFLTDVAKRGDAAYVAVVDRLLASPRFGERQAQDWLDLARYADSHGFNNDSTRSMWRWRDWVITAFNADLPYDRFVTAQVAGDLLPQATLDDRIATGFSRNHVINSEGGIIDEEYRVEYVADRVRTVGMAFLGLTLECARCHDHKYDPISQRDYYQLFACFDNVDEHGEDGRVANARPLIAAPTTTQQAQAAGLLAGLRAAEAELDRLRANERSEPWAALGELGLSDGEALLKPAIHLVLGPDGLRNAVKPEAKLLAPPSPAITRDPQFGTVIAPETSGVSLGKDHIDLGKAWSFTALVRWDGGAGTVLSSMDWNAAPAATYFGGGNEVMVTSDGHLDIRRAQMWPTYALQVVTEEALTAGLWQHVTVTSDGGRAAAGVRVYLDGRECALTVLADDLTASAGGSLRLGARSAAKPLPFPGRLGDVRLLQRVLDPTEVGIVADVRLTRVLAATPDPRRLRWARMLLARHHDAATTAVWARGEALRTARCALLREFPTTMVMEERVVPRTTHLLTRGRYDAPAEVVTPDVPTALGVPWPSGSPRNRLGLAAWLTDPAHPLTARVAVNRLWQQVFGTGLVKTVEDFGLQGEFPSHPHLLDHLARRFIAEGWRVKPLLKELVLSATYRQSSRRNAASINRDAEGRLLAGVPRLRLPAELIRDQALAIGGLLRQRLGGPSVFPYQPVELYKTVVVDAPYPGTEWLLSSGDDLYRRSLYTYWKRTVPHPVMTAFDVPDREACTARRSRTSTPLQALALLNEPGFVEAARGLGTRMLRSGGSDDRARLSFGFRLCTARAPDEREQHILLAALARHRTQFTADQDAARHFLAVGALPPDPEVPVAELAAYAALGSLLLNLDATISRE